MGCKIPRDKPVPDEKLVFIKEIQFQFYIVFFFGEKFVKLSFFLRCYKALSKP